MYDDLWTKLSAKKNYCRSKNEPLSICEYYDDDTDPDVQCEYFEKGRTSVCTWYYNSAHCKSIMAQDEGRK